MKKYLITSREFYTDTPAVFRNILSEQFKIHKPDYALYRDKSNQNYDIQAEHFVEVCASFEGIKCFIHQKVNLAKKLNANGVHLTSKQFNEIKYAKDLGLEVIISTHTQEEVLKAQAFGADAVTYGPIFHSPGKGETKGVKNLKELIEKCKIKVFALGGVIDSTQVELLQGINLYGYASIRYFFNK